MPVTAPPVLDARRGSSLADAHAERADAFTAGRRERRSRQQKHAIEDFLFEYYPVTPAALRRWHPGVGVALDGPRPARATGAGTGPTDGTVTLDVDAFLADRGDAVRFIHGLLTATLGRPALTGCFGLHEWAMVYRETDEHRHPLPLRLGAAGTDAVVETHKIRCTHFDAYRFFTPDAVELNTLRPTRGSMTAMEQPGCLHAGMDVYKWATKLGPAVPGDLLLDCFELARDIRTLDMQASPYDVTDVRPRPGRDRDARGQGRVRRAAARLRRARERAARAAWSPCARRCAV